MPENLRKGRNVAIILGFVEMVCCLASLAFYMNRKSRLIIVLIVMNWFATALGFYAKLRLSYCGLLSHAIYTISIIGGFYIYIIVDFIFTYKKYNTDLNSDIEPMSQTIIQILTTVPFLAMFFMGIYSVVLSFKVEDELEERKKNIKE
jgi:heme/copper-type cytochrome/quinol oxidase subunit 2